MNKLLAAAAAMLMLAACSSGDSANTLAGGTLTIKGTIEGQEDGFVEINIPSKESETPDSAKLEKGAFTYKIELKEPELMAIRVAGTQGGDVVFFADPGTLTIKGHKDSLYAAKVEGGVSQQYFSETQQKIRGIMEKGQALYPQYMQAQQTGNQAEMMRIEQEFTGIQQQAKTYAVDFAKSHATNVTAAYLGMVYLGEGDDEPALKTLYDTLSPAVKSSFFGKMIGDKVKASELTSIGAVAPDFTQNDVDGKPITLSSLRGQYVLVDFWASWCGPCRMENPNVVKSYNTYKDKGFTIIGVSLDKEKDKWVKAIADDNLTWNHVSDLQFWKNAAAEQYGIKSIPANFLLDKEGKIIAKNLRGEDLDKKLAELLN